MSRGLVTAVVAVVILAGAVVLRAPGLERRAMHGDEAMNAFRFRDVYEGGKYAYDPARFHGPLLAYLTLPVAWVEGRGWVDLTEVTYRRVAVALGLLLVLVPLGFGSGMSRAGALAAAALTAVSPAMVYFSRDYIHEMGLVVFTGAALVCSWRCWCSGRMMWAVFGGVCLGLMHAAKETASLHVAAMVVGWAAVSVWGGLRQTRVGVRHLGAAVLMAAVVSAALYSSFFRTPGAIVDSWAAVVHWSGKAGGGDHAHPWYFYLQTFFFTRHGSGPVWTEGAIAALAVVGAVAVVTGRGLERPQVVLGRFLLVYTVVLWVIYSAIPYKTPWSGLEMLHGMILLAGVGVGALYQWMLPTAGRVALTVLLLGAVGHLAWQAWAATRDSRNAYAYAETSSDVPAAARRVEAAAGAWRIGHPLDSGEVVQVMFRGDDYWPLPWYLRRVEGVGWYGDLPPDGKQLAPIIVVGDGLVMDLRKALNDPRRVRAETMYTFLFPPEGYELRYGAGMEAFVTDQVRVDETGP